MFLKIETNQGITGYGEGTDAVVGGYYLAKELGRQIIGKNPLDVYRLFEDLRKYNGANTFSGPQAGTFVGILSAIDIALWDITGKVLGVPVYRLLGGKFRDSVHVYTHPLENNGPPEAIGASCLESRKIGYDAIKFTVDYSIYRNTGIKQDVYNPTVNNKEIDQIVNTVAAVREAVGPDMAIMVEMHTRYDVPYQHKTGKFTRRVQSNMDRRARSCRKYGCASRNYTINKYPYLCWRESFPRISVPEPFWRRELLI